MIGYGNSMFLATHGILARGGGVTPSLLLDTYPNAAVAYSLRKLRSAYTGNAIRVRRSSDNAEQDFGFVNNVLDTASLLTFCGAGNGFVTTWYDQTTNANNSTQATAANQAQIVSTGALILDANTNKITTTWTNDRYTLTNGISANTKYLSVSMFRRENINQNLIHLGNSTSYIPTPLLWRDSTDSNRIRSFMNNNMIVDTIATLGRCIFTSLKNSTNLKVCYRNGMQLASTATEAPAVATFNVLGQSSATLYTSGQYQEYVYWDSEQSANRVGIETNINTYWNAY